MIASVQQVRKTLEVNVTGDSQSKQVNNIISPVSRADIVNLWATDWS
jgi:hypothetical protein